MNDIRTIKVLNKAKKLLLEKYAWKRINFLCHAVNEALEIYNDLPDYKAYKLQIMRLLWKHKVNADAKRFTTKNPWWGTYSILTSHFSGYKKNRVATIDATIKYLKEGAKKSK